MKVDFADSSAKDCAIMGCLLDDIFEYFPDRSTVHIINVALASLLIELKELEKKHE